MTRYLWLFLALVLVVACIVLTTTDILKPSAPQLKQTTGSLRRLYPGVKFDIFSYARWSGDTPDVYVEVAPKHGEFGTPLSRHNERNQRGERTAARIEQAKSMRIASPPGNVLRWECLHIDPEADQETLVKALAENAARAQKEYDEYIQGEQTVAGLISRAESAIKEAIY